MSEGVCVYEEVHPEPDEKVMGVIFPVGYMNQCCEDKPFILYARNNGSFNCRCGCDGWCTTGFDDPVKPIMQYEMMCRVWPDCVDFADKELIRHYFAERER